jgi:hypothetical protein
MRSDANHIGDGARSASVPTPGQELADSRPVLLEAETGPVSGSGNLPGAPVLVIRVGTSLSWVFLRNHFAYKLNRKNWLCQLTEIALVSSLEHPLFLDQVERQSDQKRTAQ